MKRKNNNRGYHNSIGIAAEERVRLVESRYGVDKELCK